METKRVTVKMTVEMTVEMTIVEASTVVPTVGTTVVPTVVPTAAPTVVTTEDAFLEELHAKFKIENPILDSKALDKSAGPFAKIYDPESKSVKALLKFPGPGCIVVISEKKNAVAYIADGKKFTAACPGAAVMTYGSVGVVYVPLKTTSCRQAIAAVMLRAGYDVPIQIYNEEGRDLALALAKAWGADAIAVEIMVAPPKNSV